MAHGTGIMGNRGYLGVEAVELTPELSEHFGAPSETGVMISRVADGSPAQNAGLQVGDILTTVDNESIGSFIDLFHEISDHEEGDVVRIEAWRNAQSLAFDATLMKMERPQVDIRRFQIGDEEGHHTVVFPDGDFEEVIELQAGAFDEAIDRLNTEWPSEDWQERLHSYSTSREELLERLNTNPPVRINGNVPNYGLIFNLPQGTGLLVERIAERSLATHMGIEGGSVGALVGDESLVVGGDVILEVMGVSIDAPTMRD